MPRRQLSPARSPRSNPWPRRCPANDVFAQRSASSGAVGSKNAWNLVPWSPSEIGALSFLETPPPYGFRRALEGRAVLHTRTNGWKFPLFVNAIRVSPKSKGVQSRHGAVTRMGANGRVRAVARRPGGSRRTRPLLDGTSGSGGALNGISLGTDRGNPERIGGREARGEIRTLPRRP